MNFEEDRIQPVTLLFCYLFCLHICYLVSISPIPPLLPSFMLNRCFLMYHFNSLAVSFISFWIIFPVISWELQFCILAYINQVQVNNNLISIVHKNFDPFQLCSIFHPWYLFSSYKWHLCILWTHGHSFLIIAKKEELQIK